MVWNKRRIVVLSSVLAIILVFAFFISSYISQLNGFPYLSEVDENRGFTIIHISDTQHLSQHNKWGTFTTWLTSIKESYNVKAIIHTGDIVQNCDNTIEWERANASMSVLVDGNVPYTWGTGNHDVNFTTMEYLGAKYTSFNTSTFDTEDYWLSSYDQQSTAINFTHGSYKFIIINIAWHGNSSHIAWLNSILETNKDANIIVATHSYLNKTGGYDLGLGGGKWELALLQILDKNPNVIFTLNGHDSGIYNNTVKNREQILFNCQGVNARTARIMNIDVTSGTVYVRTYMEYSGSWDFSEKNMFNFKVNLG